MGTGASGQCDVRSNRNGVFKGRRAVVVVHWITESVGSGNLSDVSLDDTSCDKCWVAPAVHLGVQLA